LAFGCPCRVQFLRCIPSNASSAFERSLCLPQLSRQVLQGLIVTSRLGTFICRFNCLSRSNREDVEYRKRHAQAHRPVRTVRAEACRASLEFARGVPTAAASVYRRL